MTNVSIPHSALREAALGLAEQGFSVFPLRPRAKTPLTAHGLLDATHDLDQVAAWWTANPWANIGLRTGDGLAVIDVDPRHGGKVDPAWPKTATVRTPSGGWHFYYLATEDVPCSADGRIAPGVDVRGTGGYVVSAPSRTLKGVWERESSLMAILPIDLAEAARTRPDRGAREGGEGSQPSGFVPRERVGSGERNDYLARAAGWLYRQGHDAAVEDYLALENEAVCDPPLDDEEVAQIAASIGRYNR